ncbi:ShlB/FhaC/HecB family hemolysin secretion/activation protein [Gammaproteobacteria bacterium]
MSFFPFREIPWILLSLGYGVSVWAIGDTLSMGRPSARSLPPPNYRHNSSSEVFILPAIPLSADEHSDIDHKFFVKRIVLEGNTIFPERELQAMTQPYEGREVSIAELEELRQRLTRYYIEHGYINSGAIIPADAFKDGELRFNIIEGRIDEIRLKGMNRLREDYVKNRLWNDSGKPFNLPVLQDRFQLLLLDPLITQMTGRILPGDIPGHSILDVAVTRAQPYQLSLFANNQRAPSVGAEGYGLSGWVRNLTGLGDVFDFSLTTSNGSRNYTGGASLPITGSGTQIFFHFDEGRSVVIEEPLQEINIRSKVNNLEGGIRYPLIDTLHQHLGIGLTLAIRENKTTLLNQSLSFVPGEPTGNNRGTVIRLFQDYSQQREDHALVARSTFSIGIDAWGATIAQDRNYPDSKFFAWLGQAQYAHRFSAHGSQFVVRTNAQLSNDPLLPLERMAAGGLSTVRGYRENQLVRDQGYTLSTELRYPLFGGADSNTKYHLILVPFMDYGRAWNHKQSATTLASVGIGLDWQFKLLRAEIYYGYPLDKPESLQNERLLDRGIHFQVRLDMF